jgi:hypothetical protein
VQIGLATVHVPKLVLGSGAIGVPVNLVLALPILVVNELLELTVCGEGKYLGSLSKWKH